MNIDCTKLYVTNVHSRQYIDLYWSLYGNMNNLLPRNQHLPYVVQGQIDQRRQEDGSLLCKVNGVGICFLPQAPKGNKDT